MFLKFIAVTTEFTDIKLTEAEIVSNSITVICTKTSAQVSVNESEIVTHKQKLKISHWNALHLQLVLICFELPT